MAIFETTYQSGIELIARHLEQAVRGPLRRAVVLVPAERYAHAIRRRVLVERGRPADLAGVVFTRPAELARDLLARAGRVVAPGWEAVRRLRVLDLFDRGALRTLEYFKREQLRSGHGYAVAFARTIEELEAAGLDAALCSRVAAQLQREEDPNADRLHDVAEVWAAADKERNSRASTAQLLAAAASVLEEDPAAAAPFGPAFALMSSSPSTALLRFLEALPDCRVAFQEARPLRTHTQRWRQALKLPPPRAQPAADSELSLVQRYLFEVPENLTDPGRPRSGGPDTTVDLEEYSTIEDEIEAAAVWVAEQIGAGTPLEQIALVVPESQSYAVALRDRLARLRESDTQPPIGVHIAAGLSLADTPAGRRLRILLDALLRSLEAEATIRLLPALRRGITDAEYEARLSPSRAAEIVYGAGIAGGSPGDTRGIAEWIPCLTRRRDALRLLAAEPEPADEARDEPEKRKQVIGRNQANRWLREVEPLLPGIEALQAAAQHVAAGAALAAVWNEVSDFAAKWLRLPPDPPNLLSLLSQRLQPIIDDPVAAAIKGGSAIRFLMDQLRLESVQPNRFGEPCVFIGTVAQAAGLSFTAVRMLGLAEGALPHTPHDDPIVPDVLRIRLEETARASASDIVVPRLADRVLDEIHDAYRVINGAVRRLALSAPRQWTDRSDREVSGVMLEVATALGREAAGGAGDVPTSGRLRSAYFVPGRRARAATASAAPLTPRSLFAGVKAGGQADDATPELHVPAGWLSRDSIDVARIHRLDGGDGTLDTTDGLLPATWAGVPGLADKPLSASGLTLLLGCPHRFLLERLMRLKPPALRPPSDAIEPIAYGSLFHAAVERFLAEAGAPLCRREGKLGDWVERAKAIANEELDKLCEVYPLRGADATERERSRLLRQIEQLVHYEWAKSEREFVAAELGFGEPEPVRLACEGGELLVRGAIDRVDRLAAGALAVRDIKTGRMRDLLEDPINAGRDLQIGLYTLALEAGGERVAEAAYVHPSAAHEQERSFTGAGLDQLRAHTRAWLQIARAILRAGAFVRTPIADDCQFCPFRPSCGDGAHERSAAKLRHLPQSHLLGPFVRLKQERVVDE
jgi:RecB family exonuclease